MKKDIKEFWVADGKVKWEESQRAPLRVTPFTRHNIGPVLQYDLLNFLKNFAKWLRVLGRSNLKIQNVMAQPQNKYLLIEY